MQDQNTATHYIYTRHTAYRISASDYLQNYGVTKTRLGGPPTVQGSAAELQLAWARAV